MDWALEEKVDGEKRQAQVTIHEGREAFVENGRLKARVNSAGVLFFYRDGELILLEYQRDYQGTESREGKKLFGMGQYQQPYLDLKGCCLELAQRNSQISIPFAVSSLGYGFLWNHSGVGKAVFGKIL